MTPSAPLVAAHLVWLAWGASWLAAARWRGRTIARAAAGPTRGWLLLVAIGFAALFGEPPARLHPLYRLAPALGWALVLLAAGGCTFAWWARLHLGRLWSGGIVAREGHRVVESGPYALVRHPIYTGLLAGALALAILRATPFAIAGFVVLGVAFAGKARVEERFLEAQLGAAAYRGYRARVPMLVPVPRR